MNRTPNTVWGLLLVALAAAAALVVAVEGAAPRAAGAAASDFYGLTGGLGCGPATHLGECEFSFDPRVASCCAQEFGPLPGGFYFCPQHAFSVFPCQGAAARAPAAHANAR